MLLVADVAVVGFCEGDAPEYVSLWTASSTKDTACPSASLEMSNSPDRQKKRMAKLTQKPP